MKTLLMALIVGIVSLSLLPSEADARRFGGGGSAGMQRSLPSRAAPSALPARPAPAPAPAATPAATPGVPATATAPRRSWMGPIAGLAAGLGIAALMSHFGLGAGFGNIVMVVLLALIAFVVIRLLMQRFMPASNGGAAGTHGGTQFAGAGPAAWSGTANDGAAAPTGSSWQPSAPAAVPSAVPAATAAAALPADFDTAGFERIAKLIFIRMQAANDSGDLNDLRSFTTPEMFASVRLDLQDRGAKTQQTDVVRIDAEVLDVVAEADRKIVSVRFHGLIREDKDGVAEPFDEVWHLVRPNDGSREWAIAGIQQMA